MARTEFDHDRFEEAYPPGIERSWWQRARNAVIAQAFRKYVPRNARVMEIGCGTGIVTAHLREQGWNVTGVELGTPSAGLRAPEHLLLGQDALALPLDVRERINVLCSYDVIEHIEDAPAFLKGLAGGFPNASTLVVTVPARTELWTTFDDHFGHFRRYDRALLARHFAEGGWQTLSNEYFFHGLYPAILLNNMVRGRQRALRFEAPAPGPASAVNALLGRMFAAEHALLPGALHGTSLIGVAARTPSNS
ncbi:MAG: class I SAM-dependent methyltransferase [Flavobacteriales bacterium]|nr:MAG: class I SAM-dependent methyltransferase [Flavobacteriales bacterium]